MTGVANGRVMVGRCSLQCPALPVSLCPWSEICPALVVVYFYRQVDSAVLASCITPFSYAVYRDVRVNIRRIFTSLEISFSVMAAPIHTSTRHLLRGNQSSDTSLSSHHKIAVPLFHEPDSQHHRKTWIGAFRHCVGDMTGRPFS